MTSPAHGDVITGLIYSKELSDGRRTCCRRD
jgi:hypothetical protein